jgi:uncharacterized protein
MNLHSMKLSYYSIFSEPLNERDDVALLATRTGQSCVITKEAQDHLLEGRFELLSDELRTRLVDIELLVDPEQDELQYIIDENKRSIKKTDGSLYIVIQPSANCQLGCDYCGQSHTKDYISASLQEKLVERTRNKLQEKNYPGLSVGWFGGEPLMGLSQIRLLTKEFLKLAEEQGIRYSSSIVTNGLSLKEDIFLELVRDLKVSHIEVTLDGTQEFHDNVRHTKKKEKTFDIILSNLEKILNRDDFESLNCPISIRCNVDHRNVEGVSPLIQLLAEKGLHQKIQYFYPIGIYSWGGNDAQTKSLTKEEFAQMEIDWLIEMLDLGYRPGFMPNRVKNVCMAVSDSSEMYDAFGNIFDCTEVSYSDTYGDGYVLGNLKFDEVTYSSTRTFSNWNDQILANEFQCFSCKMLPVCGGCCPKSWREGRRACPNSKFNIKEKLALAYVIASSGEYESVNEVRAIQD